MHGARVSEPLPPIPEEPLARAIFGPFGGVVEIGAVNATATWELGDVSLGDFLARKHGVVERVLDGIRSVCRFTDAAMSVADEVGWFRDHEVHAASLLMWSEGVTDVPQPVERLEQPPVVRRMCRVGADLQLTRFLQALLTAAIAAGTEPREGAARVAEILGLASDLADPTGGSAPTVIFRMWRVAHLPGILRPGSDAPAAGKAAFRAYGQELAGAAEHGRTRRGRERRAYDAFWAAPEGGAVWDALSQTALEAIARCDAERLEVERSRVAPHVREKIMAPVYSVADRFASWERLVRRMEPGWSSDDFYPISAYDNDLDSRDALDQVMRALAPETGDDPLRQLLARLDARFRAATLPDPELSLRPWVRPTAERPEEELGEWWKRKPARVPWAD